MFPNPFPQMAQQAQQAPDLMSQFRLQAAMRAGPKMNLMQTRSQSWLSGVIQKHEKRKANELPGMPMAGMFK